MQTFSPVSSNKLYVQIYHQIHDAIVSGKFKPGEKLPSERELCQAFNVSRIPVREALSALELNGLVESFQGGGVYVRENTGSVLSEMPAVEPQEIIHVRMVLEPDMAREAALHITEDEKQELKQIIERFKSEDESGASTVDTDMSFHLCVAKASGNALYEKLFDVIGLAMKQAMWELILSRTISTEKFKHQNYLEHKYIAEAIIENRADDAYNAMKKHMEKLYERYWS